MIIRDEKNLWIPSVTEGLFVHKHCKDVFKDHDMCSYWTKGIKYISKNGFPYYNRNSHVAIKFPFELTDPKIINVPV